ncbi:MAG TPA: alpha/beta hydrolase [Myxococcota bacterium]|jgi:pimeloyl-ACP methyl ester carboxylesterase
MSDEPRPIEFRGHDGLVLRGDDFGSPDAPPVVLLHGGGQTRHSWSGTALALAREGWRALSLDLRGHGESDWSPSGAYDLEDFVRDLAGVAHALPRPPVVVGASLGGMTALCAEGESQDGLLAAVVLVDVTPRLEPRGVIRIISFMTDRPEGFASLEEAADAVAAYREHRARPSDLAGLAKNLRRGDDGRWRWHWDPKFLSRDRHVGNTLTPGRLLGAARGLRVPTLLVRGKQSDVVSLEGAAEFREAAPHARFVDVSGAGHMVAGDRNDLFTEAVIGFLRSDVAR